MKLAIAQIDTVAGALQENGKKIGEFIGKAKKQGCSLVVFPEMVLTGYPICDLVYELDFLRANKKELERIASATKGISVVLGFIDFNEKEKSADGSIKKFNSAAIISDGKVVGTQVKSLLPTYDVFDEARFFTPATECGVFEVEGKKIGLTICEDIWDENYSEKPVDKLIKQGAEIIVNISASPFHLGKFAERKALAERHSSKGVLFIFANKVGSQDNGNDILVFDGNSIAANEKGEVIAVGKQFAEDLVVFDLNDKPAELPAFDESREIFEAIVFGLKGYAAKCGFKKAVLGLSGGIDSAVVACIAAKALGPENVLGVTMPSKFSSSGSVDDSRKLAENLGVEFKEWPIEEIVKINRENYEKTFGANLEGTASENPQARLRGNTLMTISNAQGRLLLSTGNKTELALGYCTLYGDMAGGVGVIGDLNKMQVYKIANYINKAMGKAVPASTIEKVPSAELAPGQEDPFDYEKVSPLVDMIIEAKSKEEILKAGFEEELVVKLKRLVDLSQYKRKQAPPVIRVTRKAFGSGRVCPIINKWKW